MTDPEDECGYDKHPRVHIQIEEQTAIKEGEEHITCRCVVPLIAVGEQQEQAERLTGDHTDAEQLEQEQEVTRHRGAKILVDLCGMSAKIGTDVESAATLLREGAIVAIPTETVYGLAANAFDEAAVLKVFEAKQRPSFDPLIVHIGRHADVMRLVTEPPPGSLALMEAFWPGPLTLVMPTPQICGQRYGFPR